MKKKLLISTSITCLAVIALSAAGIINNKTFKIARSEVKTRSVIMNKDTLVTRNCYRDDGFSISSYGFFQLTNPGSYTAFISSTYFSSTIGGNHLYETGTITSSGKGVGFAIDICGLCSNSFYFDSAKTQKINIPGISSLQEIEITLADENTAPFDEDRITSYYKASLEHDLENPNIYRITNVPSNVNSLYAIDFVSTDENINQKLIVDQVKITYVC